MAPPWLSCCATRRLPPALGGSDTAAIATHVGALDLEILGVVVDEVAVDVAGKFNATTRRLGARVLVRLLLRLHPRRFLLGVRSAATVLPSVSLDVVKHIHPLLVRFVLRPGRGRIRDLRNVRHGERLRRARGGLALRGPLQRPRVAIRPHEHLAVPLLAAVFVLHERSTRQHFRPQSRVVEGVADERQRRLFPRRDERAELRHRFPRHERAVHFRELVPSSKSVDFGHAVAQDGRDQELSVRRIDRQLRPEWALREVDLHRL